MEGIALFLNQFVLGTLIGMSVFLCVVVGTGGGGGIRGPADCSVKGVLKGLPQIF